MKKTSFALALAGAFVSVSQAQVPAVPDAGDVLRQLQQTTPQPVRPAAPLPPVGNVPLEPPLRALPDGADTFQVDAFEIVGNRVIDSATLLALVAPEQGRRFTLAALEDLAARITRAYRARGYFVARAYVPAQKLENGRLAIRVVEGNYGDFMLENRSLVRDATVQGLLDDIKDRDIVSLDTLERAMLIINDTPGVRVTRADVMPGERLGTSSFAVGTEATPRFNGFALLDNHGSRYTGRERLTFNGDWNSPNGRGDRLSLSGLAAAGGDLNSARLSYSTLVATNGTRVETAVSRTTYALGDLYSVLGASGRADGMEMNLAWPWRRTRAASVEVGAGLAHRRLTDEVSSTATETRKRATAVTGRVSGNFEHLLLGRDGLTQAQASLTAGHLSFGDAVAAALDAAGAGTQGAYAKANLAITRVTLLPAKLSLTASLRTQKALGNQNLDGSEKLSVSGVGGVAAYPGGELAGDDAAVLRLELARPLPVVAGVASNVTLFASHGWASAARRLPGQRERDLGDMGLGFNAGWRGAVLRLQLAHRVTGGAPLSEAADRTRLLAQAGWTF